MLYYIMCYTIAQHVILYYVEPVSVLWAGRAAPPRTCCQDLMIATSVCMLAAMLNEVATRICTCRHALH